MRLCQKLAQPSFMILVSICGTKYWACFVHDRQQIFFPFGELRVVIADESQKIFVWVERHFSQIGVGGLAPAVNGVKRVDRRLWLPRFALPFFAGGGFFDGEIAPALQ